MDDNVDYVPGRYIKDWKVFNLVPSLSANTLQSHIVKSVNGVQVLPVGNMTMTIVQSPIEGSDYKWVTDSKGNRYPSPLASGGVCLYSTSKTPGSSGDPTDSSMGYYIENNTMVVNYDKMLYDGSDGFAFHFWWGIVTLMGAGDGGTSAFYGVFQQFCRESLGGASPDNWNVYWVTIPHVAIRCCFSASCGMPKIPFVVPESVVVMPGTINVGETVNIVVKLHNRGDTFRKNSLGALRYSVGLGFDCGVPDLNFECAYVDIGLSRIYVDSVAPHSSVVFTHSYTLTQAHKDTYLAYDKSRSKLCVTMYY